MKKIGTPNIPEFDLCDVGRRTDGRETNQRWTHMLRQHEKKREVTHIVKADKFVEIGGETKKLGELEAVGVRLGDSHLQANEETQ
jgi:hypothetical protein